MPANRYYFMGLTFLLVAVLIFPAPAAQVATPDIVSSTLPVVAIHVSELTKALEKMPAASTDTPHPPGTPDASGCQMVLYIVALFCYPRILDGSIALG